MEAPLAPPELPGVQGSGHEDVPGPTPHPNAEEVEMSRSVNKIILVGHMGRDPEVRDTGTGKKVANVSLATNYRVGNGEGQEERTAWHRLTLWNQLAQFAEEYVRKGDRVYVEGRLDYDSYERDGVTIPTAEITVRELVLLSPRREAASEEVA